MAGGQQQQQQHMMNDGVLEVCDTEHSLSLAALGERPLCYVYI